MDIAAWNLLIQALVLGNSISKKSAPSERDAFLLQVSGSDYGLVFNVNEYALRIDLIGV